MTIEEFLSSLGYQGSPCFLQRGDGRFESERGYGHIFRRAKDRKNSTISRWQAEGVYGVRDLKSKPEQFIPIVYVCTAKDEMAAGELHRLVWNQDVVPYILVHSPKGVIIYSGFRFSKKATTDEARGVLLALTDFNNVQTIINLFHAREIDEGRLWQQPRLKVDASQRVYHQLLASLKVLDKSLRGDGLTKEVSHALIGQYVYLRYLRDRDILSDERLDGWGLKEADIFGRTAKKSSLAKLTDELDSWLNGEVFPLPWRGDDAPSATQIQAVAGVFKGDEMTEDGIQQHLSFQAYDFSFIPIETLSLVYEQFLHIEDKKSSQGNENASAPKLTKGRTEGIYYTPLPLVNFMLAEMERQHPLEKGMKVWDPSCGSGAFLVQAFRLLIEKTFPTNKVRPRPTQLRELLESSIFGCDVDSDACQVTQLSLLLTLLDYINPPDLLQYPMFQLPTLGKTANPKKQNEGHTPNIINENFFGIEPALRAAVAGNKATTLNWSREGFDWIVGNPPWKSISPKSLGENDAPVWEWMKVNAKTKPVGLNQAAQAFAWEAPRYLKADGECTLLLPGMGLFEEPSQGFRKAFFNTFQVHTVANFANFANILFDGRAHVAAAAWSYRLRPEGQPPQPDEIITVFSPFVVNQEATCPLVEGKRGKVWSLIINGSELRTLDQEEVVNGSGLPWKLAMWGSQWDEKLLRRLEKKWPSLHSIEAKWDSKSNKFISQSSSQVLGVTEGLQLRGKTKNDTEENDPTPIPEASGAKALDMDAMESLRNVFHLPKHATVQLAKIDWFGRKGRIQLPLAVCQPPHVIVSAARNFAVYSDEFIIVPPRQIGIVSPLQDKDFLKALSLFLSSDFAFYHQFLRSTELGIKRDRATLEALRKIPVPLTNLSRSELKEWVALHAKLAKCQPQKLEDRKKQKESEQGDFFVAANTPLNDLLKQLNQMTADVLGLDKQEQALIHDLVQVRYALNEGKRGDAAMRDPDLKELQSYAEALKEELDDFVGADFGRFHRVTVVVDTKSAMVEIDFTKDTKAAQKTTIVAADNSETKAFDKTRRLILHEHAQWVYFNRNLRVYRGRKTYIFKPLNRFHWTQSTALMDASEIIGETLASTNN